MADKYYKVVAENRKARFDFIILEVYKAGLVLTGSEVKSLRQGKVQLKDSFGRTEKGAIWLYNLHISPWDTADKSRVDPLRPRKVLLKSREELKLCSQVAEKGLTLVPLKLYFDGNWAKVDLALVRAKKKFEKRDAIRLRTVQKEIASALKGNSYGRKNEK